MGYDAKKTIESAYNVEASEEKGIITLIIDTTKEPKLSSTGASHLIASTGGNVVCGTTKQGKEIFLGLNMYVRRTKGFID